MCVVIVSMICSKENNTFYTYILKALTMEWHYCTDVNYRSVLDERVKAVSRDYKPFVVHKLLANMELSFVV